MLLLRMTILWRYMELHVVRRDSYHMVDMRGADLVSRVCPDRWWWALAKMLGSGRGRGQDLAVGLGILDNE